MSSTGKRTPLLLRLGLRNRSHNEQRQHHNRTWTTSKTYEVQVQFQERRRREAGGLTHRRGRPSPALLERDLLASGSRTVNEGSSAPATPSPSRPAADRTLSIPVSISRPVAPPNPATTQPTSTTLTFASGDAYQVIHASRPPTTLTGMTRPSTWHSASSPPPSAQALSRPPN